MAPIKVYLTGGDNMGWALDEDLAQTKKALALCGKEIELTSLDKAQVIHTAWPLMLKEIPADILRSKRVISHMPNQPFHLTQDPLFPIYRNRTGLWIAQTKQAITQLSDLKLNSKYVPYTIEASRFDKRLGNSGGEFTRKNLGIPNDRFVIGSFQRDTEGADLTKPKLVKGPDILLTLLIQAKERGVPLHVLLAGPRRHWLREQLKRNGIPFTFVGTEFPGDDHDRNTLSLDKLAELYRIIDLYIVSSRSEGGPRSVLEASASKTAIISSPVGLALDILNSESIYYTLEQGAQLILNHFKDSSLKNATDSALRNVLESHSASYAAKCWGEIYSHIDEIPIVGIGAPNQAISNHAPSSSIIPAKIRMQITRLRNRILPKQSIKKLRINLIYEFHKPPYGGGNQFFLALKKGLTDLGVKVTSNALSTAPDLHIVNSNWFDVEKFTRFCEKYRPKLLHRIDGPTCVVRGNNDRAPDDQCFNLNRDFAAATVLQSNWSYSRILELGYNPVNPTVVYNCVDDSIFNTRNRIPDPLNNKIRLIASSWSDNPRKGTPIYKWLESQLDFNRFEFTFAGRTKERFTKINHIDALPSEKLSKLLQAQDIYITASIDDPCSNAVLEAMACGLPVLYIKSGGHPEIVSYGGLPFTTNESILPALEELSCGLKLYRSLITVPSLEDTAKRYLEIASSIA